MVSLIFVKSYVLYTIENFHLTRKILGTGVIPALNTDKYPKKKYGGSKLCLIPKRQSMLIFMELNLWGTVLRLFNTT